MIRPLLTAFIEYVLAYIVFKNGKVQKNVIAATLFFLATYQLGEVLIFLTNGHEVGFKVAYIATTLLPPLGVLLIQKIIKKPIGYIFFQLLGLGFVSYILFIPHVALKFEFGQFCIRIFEYEKILSQYWFVYYQGTLLFTMMAMLWGIRNAKEAETKSLLQHILFAYLSFDAGALIIAYTIPWFGPSTASLMCAMALVASFIFSKIALGENWSKHFAINKSIKDLISWRP
jgi:hypothetical protein